MSDRKPNRERVYLSDDEVTFLDSLGKKNMREAIRFCIGKEKNRAAWREQDKRKRLKQRQAVSTKAAQA